MVWSSKHCIFSSGAYFYSMVEINFRFEEIFPREKIGPSKDVFPAMKSSKDWKILLSNSSWKQIQRVQDFSTKLLNLSSKR